MEMYDPPHPGKIVKEAMEELNLTTRGLARLLGVAPSTVQRLLSGQSAVSPDMALRLETVIGSSADVWLSIQAKHDLWQARQRFNKEQLTPAWQPELQPA